MALLPQVVLAAAKLDDADLVTLAMRLHRGSHPGTGDIGRAYGDVDALAHYEDLVELHGGAGLGVELLDAHDGPRAHPVLLATRGNDGVHNCLTPKDRRPYGQPEKSPQL